MRALSWTDSGHEAVCGDEDNHECPVFVLFASQLTNTWNFPSRHHNNPRYAVKSELATVLPSISRRTLQYTAMKL